MMSRDHVPSALSCLALAWVAALATGCTGPEAALGYNRRGVAASKAGRPDEALRLYNSAIEAHPPYARAWSNRGIEHWDAKRYDQAYSDWVQCAKLDPNMTVNLGGKKIPIRQAAMRAAHLKGTEVRRPGDDATAEKWFTRALEVDPTPSVAHVWRAAAHIWRACARRRQGNLKGAQADLNRYLEYDPRYKPVRAEFGTLLLDIERRPRICRDLMLAAARAEANRNFLNAFRDYGKAYALSRANPDLGEMMEAVLSQQKRTGAWLGLSFRLLAPDEYLKLGVEDGLRVDEVIPGDPAHAAGIKVGDVLLEFDGRRVKEVQQFRDMIVSAPIGAVVPLKVMRGKDNLEVKATLVERRHGLETDAGLAAALVDCYQKCPAKPKLPESARRYRVMAETRIRERKYKEAVGLMERALLIAPWWPEGHYNRARLLADLKRYPEAIQNMKCYLRIVPDAPNARAVKDKIYEWEAKTK